MIVKSVVDDVEFSIVIASKAITEAVITFLKTRFN